MLALRRVSPPITRQYSKIVIRTFRESKKIYGVVCVSACCYRIDANPELARTYYDPELARTVTVNTKKVPETVKPFL